MIPRKKDVCEVRRRLKTFPVVGLLGPRQCGKTTLARSLRCDHYFDLENPRHLRRLENPQLALEELKGTIVIDEIQRKPNLFPLLRVLVDGDRRQKYLILGSASRDLIRQGSESLAGRISYYYLGGFRPNDVGEKHRKRLWLRGGLPRSFTARTDEASLLWRESYISTFLERDIPQLGFQIPAPALRRFWTMLCHYHGQIVNYSELGRSFGASDMTVRKYLDILAGTFMVRVLPPWHANLGKRLVKRPKIYLRDAGVFHALQSIRTQDDLISHNRLGASWEGFALECVVRSLNIAPDRFYFWATHGGAELDLFWQDRGRNWGIEFKYADAPKLTKSARTAREDLNLAHLWIVYPGKESYKLSRDVTVLSLSESEALPSLYEIGKKR